MKKNTKENILSTAIRAFNKNGYAAVSLYELATKLDISRGNLTYHFKDKDILLQAISEQMWQKMEVEKNKSRQLPSFENLHKTVQFYYHFQKEYAFIFLDPHVLKHPIIKKQFREMTEKSIADNEAAIAFSIRMGNMYPERIKGTYHNISFITWMLTFFWLAQQIIRGEKTTEDGEKMIWSILIPHFTDKGIERFKAFFGEEYFDSLGPKFEVDLSKIISF